MREKLESFPLATLKEFAKEKGIKGFYTLKKSEIIDELCKIADAEAAPAPKTYSKEVNKYTENIEDDPYRQDFDPEMAEKGPDANGILEVMPEGYGFIRCENFDFLTELFF